MSPRRLTLPSRGLTRHFVVNGRREWILYLLVMTAYLLLRVLLIPTEADLTNAFSHDSGYLALVADNLVKGRGYVQEALWLVFLMPAALPMPYHNANPLFPTVTAAVTWLTGDVFQSGFIVAAFASVLLLGAVIALFRPMVRTPWQAIGLASAVVLFPPVLTDSFLYLTDALCASLVIGSVAIINRTNSSSAFFVAGGLLGLAWLTRAATVLVAPALLVYLLLRFDLRTAASRLTVMLIAAVLISSPWLVHTKRVWGSFFRSDSGYAMVQVLAAKKSHQNSVVRFWHSTEAPASLGTFVLDAPAAVIRQVTIGTFIIAKRTLGWWSMHSVPIALVLLGGLLVWTFERRRWWSPEAAAFTVFAVTTVVVLSIRAEEFEERYVDTLTILFAIFAVAGCWRAWQRSTRTLRPLCALALVVVWAALIPVGIVKTYSQTYAPDAALTAYRAAASEMDRRYAQGQPVVVGMVPYFYALETRSPALNFPDASDEFLLRYMDKYNARYVFLTRDELQFWRPSWTSPSALPKGLRMRGVVADGFVFEKTRRADAMASGGSARP